MRRRALLAMAVGLVGCATVTSPGEARYAGFYESGFEVESFRPCEGEERWWVTAGEELRRRYRDVAGREYEPVFVVVRGEVGPPGRYGHLGAYAREIAVREVVEIRPARATDCGGRG